MNKPQGRKFYTHLILQTLMAAVFVYAALFALDRIVTSTIIWAAGASSLASSAFILFCSPSSSVAKPRRIIAGYLIAVFVGEGMRLGAQGVYFLLHMSHITIPPIVVFEFAAAISVAVTLMLMIFLKSEHPPAAGLAVVMVLDIRNYEALTIILIAVIILALIRKFCCKLLCDLTE